MRYPVIPTLFLILLAMTGAVIAPNVLQISPTKYVLVDRLNAQSGLQLTVRGDIRLRFLPRPQIILNDVVVRSEVEIEQKLQAEKIILNLSVLDLLQDKFVLQGVYLLRADSDLVLGDGVGGLIERLAAIAHPGVRFIDSKFTLRGLSAYDASHIVTIEHIGLDFAARGLRDDMRVVLRQTLPGRPGVIFRGRLGNLDARRQDLSVSLQFAANERIGFDGFLRQTAQDWRADGEMRVDSEAMISKLAEGRLPLALTPSARRVAFSGLVQFDRTGVRSENLEIAALDTTFQSRLSLDWPQTANEKPRLTGRLSTGVINFDNLSTSHIDAEATNSAISDVWQAFEKTLDVALRVEATRFDVGGESGQNLLLAFDWRDDKIDVQRFSLNLPFRSLFLASGLLDLGDNGPSFKGSFSTRSTDALAAGLWLGSLAGVDSSQLVETLDESRLQRVSLVGDVGWSRQGIAFSAVSGRLADDRLSADIDLALSQSWRGRFDLQFERLDLADWGAVSAGSASDQNVMTGLLAPLNAAFAGLLRTADDGRDIRVDISTERLFSGVTDLGPAQFSAQITDQILELDALNLSDYQGLNIGLSGRLQYQGASPHGEMAASIRGEGGLPPGLARQLPFSTPDATNIDYGVTWVLSAPDAPVWPNTILQGEGMLGEISSSFRLQGPARQISFEAAGQRLDVTMSGRADSIAQLVNLAGPYDGMQSGELQLEMENQTSNIAQIKAALSVAEDRLSLVGSMRRNSAGRRIEGAFSYNIADGLSLFVPKLDQAPMPLTGTVQVTSDVGSLSFSGLSAVLGDGSITGEGVVDLASAHPKLTANIKADTIDLSWVLPHFGANGWSDRAMQWPVFSRADLDVELSGTNITFGHLHLDELIARVKLLDGVMEAPQISGRALDGSFAGSLLAEGGLLTPYFNLDLRLSEMNPSALLTNLFSESLLQTRLGGTLNLSGRGASPRAMMASLNGGMQVDLAAGQLLFIDMEAFRSAAQATDFAGKASEIVQPVKDATASRFMRGIGLMEVQNGRANRVNLDFVFDPAVSPRDGSFDAQFDFVTGEMLGDLTLYPTPGPRKLLWQLSDNLAGPKIALNAGDFDAVPPNAEASESVSNSAVPKSE